MLDSEIVEYHRRMQAAHSLGGVAQCLFNARCKSLGLNPRKAELADIVEAEAWEGHLADTSRDDEILYAWAAGRTGPQILVDLKVNFNQFQAAMKRARAIGDQRAVYKRGVMRTDENMVFPHVRGALKARGAYSTTHKPSNLTKSIP